MSKVRADINSSSGKKRSKEYIRQCVRDGRERTYGGSHILTIERMEKLAQELVEMIKSSAASMMLPQSVLDNVNSITYGEIKFIRENNKEDLYAVRFTFTDDLSRYSLLITSGRRKGERTGSGIQNIIKLFEEGTDNPRHTVVRGLWDGHEELGEIYAVGERHGLHFLRDAVTTFNEFYGSLYNVTAYMYDTL